MKQFEYKMVRVGSEEELNAAGKEGWELVGYGMMNGIGGFYFKREVEVKKAAKKKEDK